MASHPAVLLGLALVVACGGGSEAGGQSAAEGGQETSSGAGESSDASTSPGSTAQTGGSQGEGSSEGDTTSTPPSTSTAGDPDTSSDGGTESTGGEPAIPEVTKIYWNRDLTVMRSDLDGANVEAVFDIPSQNIWVEAIALDETNDKIIVVEQYDFGMFRANLDGTDVEQIGTVEQPFTGLVVDSAGGNLYWSVEDLFGHAGLWRAGLDGSNPVRLRDDDDFQGLDVAGDPAGLFIALTEPSRIARLDLDGAPIDSWAWPNDLGDSMMKVEVDLEDERIYFQMLTFGGDFVQRGTLTLEPALAVDDIEVLVTAQTISAFGLDRVSEKIYWRADEGVLGWSIHRADLDGGNPEIVHQWADDSTIRGTMALLAR